MKKCCAAILMCLPLGAMAYPIDVDKHLDGVKLDYTAYDTAYDIGAITLNNYGQVAAACKVTFRNGPEAPRVRRVNVAAGKAPTSRPNSTGRSSSCASPCNAVRNKLINR